MYMQINNVLHMFKSLNNNNEAINQKIGLHCHISNPY